MQRRRLLAGLAGLGGAAGLGWLSGCLGAPTAGPDGDTRPTGDGESRPARGDDGGSLPPGTFGYPSTICETSVVEDFSIRAIVEPAFGADWDDADVDDRYRRDGDGLGDEDVVIGVEHAGDARAYPLSVVWWHEIVNDAIGTGAARLPLLVTYCSICLSGLVAERRVAGESTVFGVSGQLWRPPGLQFEASRAGNRTFGADVGYADAEVRNGGNLVMYDEATGSYWSQILGKAICGPEAGDRLRIVPSEVTTWRAWRADHPDTRVLLPPPHSALQ